MKHRHLDLPAETPTEELPSPALVDLLERGDLDDWLPVAAAVARDPGGAFADRVSRLVDAFPIYGTSALWRAWIERCRARAGGPAPGTRPTSLADLRRRSGLTQVELADRMGLSQFDLSKLERRRDVRLSTIRAHAAALGGRLRVLLERDGSAVEILIGAPGTVETRRRGGRRNR